MFRKNNIRKIVCNTDSHVKINYILANEYGNPLDCIDISPRYTYNKYPESEAFSDEIMDRLYMAFKKRIKHNV